MADFLKGKIRTGSRLSVVSAYFTTFRESIGIASLKDSLAAAQRTFSAWARQHSGERKTKDLLEKLSSAFFKLLDELTIARSRKHIQRYYKSSVSALGGFPERNKPLTIFPEIDTKGRFLSYDKLNDEINGYKLSLFAPSRYVKEEFKPRYQTHASDPFSQADRERFLVGMMKVNFLKRLESSVKSFEITMDRTISKIESLEQKIRNFLATPNQNPESNELELDIGDPGQDEELEQAMLVGGKFKYRLEHLELDTGKNWLKDLKKDKDQLRILLNAAQNVTADTDAKLKELRKLIAANRGVRPLPNLETKFVAANTLIGVNQPGQQLLRNRDIDAKEAELRRVRERHFLARTPKAKAKCREDDARLRAEIAELLKGDGWDKDTATKLASWNPYDQNASADFFDAEWMFGLADGFAVVVGNPPYGFHRIHGNEAKAYFKQHFVASQGSYEHYFLFYEAGLRLLGKSGALAFIAPVTWLTIPSAKSLRRFVLGNYSLSEIAWLSEEAFESASVNTLISLISANTPSMTRVKIFETLVQFPAEPQAQRDISQSHCSWKWSRAWH